MSLLVMLKYFFTEHKNQNQTASLEIVSVNNLFQPKLFFPIVLAEWFWLLNFFCWKSLVFILENIPPPPGSILVCKASFHNPINSQWIKSGTALLFFPTHWISCVGNGGCETCFMLAWFHNVKYDVKETFLMAHLKNAVMFCFLHADLSDMFLSFEHFIRNV